MTVPLPDFVRVNSPTFGDDLLAHPQDIQGDFMTVRLELPDGHSAVQDAIADGFTPDQAEFIDTIHMQEVSLVDGEDFLKSRWYTLLLADREDILRRRKEAQIEAKRQEFARGKKSNFPNLPMHPRSR